VRLALAAAVIACSVGSAMADPIRVVAFGTSLTARQEWQAEVVTRLDDSCAAIEIITVAKGGMNSDWAVDMLPQVVAERPALVLIEFAVNDASLLHGLSSQQSRTNTETIVDTLANAGARPLLMTMNPARGLNGLSRPWLADAYQLYRDIAGERGVTLIDLAPLWEARGDLDALIPDGVHPTADAARDVIAPTVAEALQPLLCP
jgi:acyl-CoA thioesterase-1